MLEIAGLIVTVLAVWGVLLNNRLNRTCFLLWLVSNLISAGIHCVMGPWSLVVRDVIFFILAAEGWLLWGQQMEDGRPKTEDGKLKIERDGL